MNPGVSASGLMTVDPAVARFFNRAKSSAYEAGIALKEVAIQMTQGGQFGEHLEEGQSTWAPLDPEYADQKPTDEIFVLTGKVKETISGDVGRGVSAYFGSSVEAASSIPDKVQYNAKGLYVRLTGLRGEGVKSLTIGFVGVFKTNALAKKGILGAKKKVAAGSAGYSGQGKTARFIKPTDNMAYANIVQSGAFKGLRNRAGQTITAKELGYHRARAKKGTLLQRRESNRILRSFAGGKTALRRGDVQELRGTARPLLPLQSADEPVISEALERGVKYALENEGLVL